MPPTAATPIATDLFRVCCPDPGPLRMALHFRKRSGGAAMLLFFENTGAR